MDQQVPQRPRLLPALAKQIGEWFPELGGRAVAVSEADITKENIPTLPLAMVGFSRGVSEHPVNSAAYTVTMSDSIVVEFWLEPARYKRGDGTETPFWSYYDYESIRNVLLVNLLNWRGPNHEKFAYRNLTIEATPLAIILTFTVLATFQWCYDLPDQEGDGTVITDRTIDYKICAPVSEICDPAFDESLP